MKNALIYIWFIDGILGIFSTSSVEDPFWLAGKDDLDNFEGYRWIFISRPYIEAIYV